MSWLSELDISGNPCMASQTNRLRLMQVLMILTEQYPKVNSVTAITAFYDL